MHLYSNIFLLSLECSAGGIACGRAGHCGCLPRMSCVSWAAAFQGRFNRNSPGQVVSGIRANPKFYEGIRIKHRVNQNSVKMHSKAAKSSPPWPPHVRPTSKNWQRQRDAQENPAAKTRNARISMKSRILRRLIRLFIDIGGFLVFPARFFEDASRRRSL